MEQNPNTLDRGRRLARRRMAWIAFLAMVGVAAAMTAGPFFGGALFAANMAAVSPVLIAVLWAMAAIVGAYLGVSLTEALKRP